MPQYQMIAGTGSEKINSNKELGEVGLQCPGGHCRPHPFSASQHLTRLVAEYSSGQVGLRYPDVFSDHGEICYPATRSAIAAPVVQAAVEVEPPELAPPPRLRLPIKNKSSISRPVVLRNTFAMEFPMSLECCACSYSTEKTPSVTVASAAVTLDL